MNLAPAILGQGEIVLLETAHDPDQPLPPEKCAAEVLIPLYSRSHRPIPLLKQLPNLGMVQLLSAGSDEWAADVPPHVTLATAKGAHAGPVSEWVLSAIRCLYRQWPALMRYQDHQTWAKRRVDADILDGKRALIVGAGHIGTAVAERRPSEPQPHWWGVPHAARFAGQGRP